MPPADPQHPRRPQHPPRANRTAGPIRQRSECRPPEPHPTGWEATAAQMGQTLQSNPTQVVPQPEGDQGEPTPTRSTAHPGARPPEAPVPIAPMHLLEEEAADSQPTASRGPRPGWQAVPVTPPHSATPSRAKTTATKTSTGAAHRISQGPNAPTRSTEEPEAAHPTPAAPATDDSSAAERGKRTRPTRNGRPNRPTSPLSQYSIRDRQRPRIVSLDVARGVMLMVSVLSASLVTTPMPPAFTHAAWFGVHFLDLVFPVFVTMSGVGFAFAYARRVRPVVVLRRAVVLILLGLGYTALTTQTYTLATLRFTGVLQLYGVLAFCQGILHWKLRTWKAWFRWTTLLTILLTALHVGWPPLICEMTGLTQTCNPSLFVDTAVFGNAHSYQQGLAGHDPEGIVAILGALLSMSAGTTLGHLLLQARRTGQRPLQAVSFLLMYCAALGAGLSFAVEPFKRLWTPSFALLACIPALAIVVVFWLILDRPDADATPSVPYYLRPLVSLGKNSLFVYFGSHLFMAMALQTGTETTPAWPVTLAEHIGWTPWGLGILCVLTWTLLAMILDRYKIYIRA